MTVNVSLEELVKAGAHFGHQTKRWNPKMREYIHSEQEGIHIIDLVKTKEELDTALSFLTKSISEGKKVLLVGTKKQAKDMVSKAAKEAGVYYVNERWLGGTLTNFSQIRSSARKLVEMKDNFAKGAYREFTKKERVLLEREMTRLDRFFGGIVGLEAAPEILIVIDTKREFAAIREARTTKTPTVGLIDTNSDPTLVDYSIPMNDDATKALEYVLGLFRDAILEGRNVKTVEKQKDLKTEKVKKEEKTEKMKDEKTKETKKEIKSQSSKVKTKTQKSK